MANALRKMTKERATDATHVLEYIADNAGRYTVRITSESGEGEYLLRIAGATGATTSPLVIIGSTPDDGAQLEEIPTELTLEFSTSVDLASVEASDVLIGGLPATSVEALQANQLRFTIDPAYFSGHRNL